MKTKNILLFLVLSIMLLFSSIQVMAASTVTVTIVDGKNTKKLDDDTSYKIMLTSGNKLSKDALAKIDNWIKNNVVGRDQATREAFSVTTPTNISSVIKKDTTFKLVYKQEKPVINFYDGVTNKIFLTKVIKTYSFFTYPGDTPEHAGYMFTGWKGQSGSKPIKKIGTYKVTALYKQISYILEFDGDGASNPNVMSSVDLSYAKKYKLPKNKYKKEKYAFSGWKINGQTYQSGDTVSKLTSKDGSTVKCTAVWSRVEDYNITYNLNGGEWKNESAVKYQYSDDTDTFSLQTPKRTGYTFAGWTGTALTSAKKSVSVKKGSTGNRTYTATWKPNTYTISFNKNGGKGTMKSIKATYDQKIKIPECTFTRFRYGFQYWQDPSGNIFYVGKSYQNLTSKSSISLKAIWVIDPKMDSKLTIDANGGKYEGEAKKVIYSHEGDYIVLKNPVRNGYIFAGWSVFGEPSLIGDNKIRFKGDNGVAKAIWKSTGTLFISNRIQDNGGNNRTETARFIVCLYHDGIGVNETYKCNGIMDSIEFKNGMADFYLKSGENISIYSIPDGYTISVEQEEIPGYSIIQPQNSHKVESTMKGLSRVSVTFVNRKR